MRMKLILGAAAVLVAGGIAALVLEQRQFDNRRSNLRDYRDWHRDWR